MGGLVAQLKVYAAKLPPIVHLSRKQVPTAVKAKILRQSKSMGRLVSRFRNSRAGTSYKSE